MREIRGVARQDAQTRLPSGEDAPLTERGVLPVSLRINSKIETQLGNQIRGLLAEYGIILPLHVSQIRRNLLVLSSEEHPLLSGFARSGWQIYIRSCVCWTKRIPALEGKIEASFAANALCQKIAKVDGVEPVIATAVVAAIADGRAFRNGRQFAAWVGLVPRQHSSGDKQRLLGITKRGDPYLRMLLIHGARSVVYRAPGKTDSRHRWIAEKQRKLRTTKASVAVANKNARIIWALLAKDEPRTGWRLSEFQRDCRTNAVMAQLVRPALRKPAGQLGRTSQSDEADDVSEGKSANSIRARG